MNQKHKKHSHIYDKVKALSAEELKFRRNLYPDVSIIEGRRVQCTVCLKDIKHIILYKRKVHIHKHLNVLLCKDCYSFYGDGDFSVDEDGLDKYCRWCGQGGHLYMCSKCPCAICKKCIKQNLTRGAINDVDKDEWQCYMCNDAPLQELRALCWAVEEHVQNLDKKKKKSYIKSDNFEEKFKSTSTSSSKILDGDFNSKKLFVEGRKWIYDFQEDSISFSKVLKKRIDVLAKNTDQLYNRRELDTNVNSLNRIFEQSQQTINSFQESLTRYYKKWLEKKKNIAESKENIEEISIISDIDSITDGVDEVTENSKLDIGNLSDKEVISANKKVNKEDLPIKPLLRIRNVDELNSNVAGEEVNGNFKNTLNETSENRSSIQKDTPIKKRSEKPVDKEESGRTKIEIGEKKAEKSSETRDSEPSAEVVNLTEDNNLDERKQKKSSSRNSSDVETLFSSNSPDSDSRRKKKRTKRKSRNTVESSSEEKKRSSRTNRRSQRKVIEETDSSSQDSIAVTRIRLGKKRMSSKSEVSGISSLSDDSNKQSMKKAEDQKQEIVEASQNSSTDEIIDETPKKQQEKEKSNNQLSTKTEKSSKNSEDQEETRLFTYTSSDDDLRRVLNLKSLEKKRKHNNSSGSDTSKTSNSKTSKTPKKKLKKTEEITLSDCANKSEGEDAEKSDNLELEKELELTSLKVDGGNVDLGKAVLDFLSQSADDEGLIEDTDSESENDETKKKKSQNAKSKPQKAEMDDDEKVKSNKKKLKTDKLLRTKLSDTDTSEAEEKYRNHLKKKNSKNSDGSVSGTDEISKKKKKENKSRRRKIFQSSDSSSSSSDDENKPDPSEKSDDSDKCKTPPSSSKRRKRIRANSTDDSGSDKQKISEDEQKNPDSSGKGRKNIRKVLKSEDLKLSTQNALKEEQERKKRIMEKQKLFNSLINSKNADEDKQLDEVVLDFNAETKKSLLAVDKNLVKKLKPHQAEGIKFMWDSCFETLEDTKNKKGSGCILAHCMGLGKSLQVVTLLHTLLTHDETGIKTAMVVCPVSTVLNWVNEFDKWLRDVGSGQDIEVYHMAKTQTTYRVFQLKDWHKTGGVMIIGYNLYRILSNEKIKLKASAKAVYRQTLVDPGPDIVICDEGHLLKNEATAISLAMNKIKTKRRIVLTGTPLQNNLVEYHCMVQFVKPSLLGTKKEFKNRFVNPIQNGQFEDSTAHDVKVMKRRAHVLHTMLDGIVQRKDYSVLTPYLPPKFEYVIHLKVSDVQCTLYRHYLEQEAKRKLFMDFQSLMRVCIHPRALLLKSEKDILKEDFDESEGSLKDFIDDGDDSSLDSSSSSSLSSSSVRSKSASVASDSNKPKRRTRANADEEEESVIPARRSEWWSELVNDEQFEDIRQGTKIFLLFVILKYCEEIGDKLLVFSQSLYTLDVIEYFLNKIDQESDIDPKLSEFRSSWAKGLDYFRMDGGSSFDNRHECCKRFNNENNPRARLFLISTKAGGLGINLTGANRVIIFDASWNPSFDVQSLFRVYRFGQKKPCYIYRFLSKGTMEEKIYERQVAKLSTSLRVIDEQQIDRHFSHSALAELYIFDPEGSELQSTPVLPKDRLMAELLQSHSDIILSYHQHDSLLENQEDQELSEEERKAAWLEYENEKQPKPFYGGFHLPTVLHDLEMKLRAQLPNLNDEEYKKRALDLFQKFQAYKLAESQRMQQDQYQFQLQNTLQQMNQQMNVPPTPMNLQNIVPNFSNATSVLMKALPPPPRLDGGLLFPKSLPSINSPQFALNPKAIFAAANKSTAYGKPTESHQILKAPPEMAEPSNKSNETIVVNDD